MTNPGHFLFFVCAILLIATGTAMLQTPSAACAICFYGPDNIAFDSQGNGYITDSDHKSKYRIVKVSPEGKKIDEWHVFVGGPGTRKGPEGIVVNHRGNILVTDGGSLRILELSPDGTLIRSIGSTKGTFRSLGHIAIDPIDRVYVSDSEANSILTFSSEGTIEAVWKRTAGGNLDQLRGPEGIAIAPDDSLVVEDWGNQRVSFLAHDGGTRAIFSLSNKFRVFGRSAGISLDHDGNVYVADNKLHRVQKFDRGGRLLSTLPVPGARPIFLSGPDSVNTDKVGNLYLADGSTMVKLSPTGTIIQRWR